MRTDNYLGIEPSRDNWGSQALRCAAVVILNGREYVFYYGNGFGETGLGVAVREE